jgi:phage terminase large subunit
MTVHVYAPRGSALEIMHRREPEVLLAGPAGTGKSRAALEKMHLAALKYPGMRAVIVRKTQTSLASTALATFRQYVAKEAIKRQTVSWYGGSPAEAPQYRYDNGSTIHVIGMDKATKIMSAEYDLVFCQEATELTLDDWEAITTRLRNGVMPYQQLIADCNPSHPTHWLRQRAETGQLVMINCRHEDNPMLYEDDGTLTARGVDYMSKLDALTGVRKARLRYGQWVAAEGIIYEEWSDAVHLVDRFEPPESWPRYWSIDFGYTNPFVWQSWAIDPDGRAYLYRELYMTGRTVAQHADQVNKIVRPFGVWKEPRPVRVLADHDAENRAVFAQSVGISTTPADKKVLEGIQLVQERLKVAAVGQPRLFLMRDIGIERDETLADARKPMSTYEEIMGYVWDTGAGKATKEQPLKKDDHGMDALRYLVSDLDGGSKPRVRMM